MKRIPCASASQCWRFQEINMHLNDGLCTRWLQKLMHTICEEYRGFRTVIKDSSWMFCRSQRIWGPSQKKRPRSSLRSSTSEFKTESMGRKSVDLWEIQGFNLCQSPWLFLCRYIGDNIKLLIERADGTYCFRLHKDRFNRRPLSCVLSRKI